MAVSLVELNGMIGRTQEFSALKQSEDNRPLVEQANMQIRHEKEIDANAGKVQATDEADKMQNHADAKEKGNGNYMGDGGKKRNPKEKVPQDGKVVLKGTSHFDISI